MKKLLALAAAVIMLFLTLVLPVSAAEGDFDITEYPSLATPDNNGATVEAYKFVYDADKDNNFWLSGKYIHSVPKLTYETETAQKINQKILDDFIDEQDYVIWLMVEQIPCEDGPNYYCNTRYASLIDEKGIVVIVMSMNSGVAATCACGTTYKAYYYSPETDSELSVDEYLALHETSREEISARFSHENDYLKHTDPDTEEPAIVPAENIHFAIYHADGTETVLAKVPSWDGYYDRFFGTSVSFAPQTGFTTAIYAAVAAVSAAAVVAVGKKRRR